MEKQMIFGWYEDGMNSAHVETFSRQRKDGKAKGRQSYEAWLRSIGIEFDESQCGGVFDGHGVVSDADPGL